jgi:hypothetical protein
MIGGDSGRSAVAALAALALVLLTGPARADDEAASDDQEQAGFRLWISARGDYFSGSSDLFKQFDNDFGAGLDFGLAFGAFAVSTEALIMGNGQYLFDANLGAEWLFDEGVRLGVGLFTGPMLFLFPQQQAQSADFSLLTPSQQQALLAATGLTSLAQAEAEFNTATQSEQDLGRLAFGWNIARLRLSADVPVGPFYLGVAGQLGYHLLISGKDVAAGIENRAVDEYAKRYNLPSSLVSEVRDVVGAHAVDTSKLHGINWDAYLYVRLEF